MRLAKSLVAIGEIELMSTTTLPGDSPLAIPSAENSTSSTSGVSGTMRMTISAASAISFNVPQTVAPFAFTSSGTVRLP